jgi:hypothetical protein
MRARKSENNFVSGDDKYFDPFFTQLQAALLDSTAEASVDEIRQSIFSVGPEGGQPVGSGFLLGDTGLLVTDSSILTGLGQRFALGVKAEVRPLWRQGQVEQIAPKPDPRFLGETGGLSVDMPQPLSCLTGSFSG